MQQSSELIQTATNISANTKQRVAAYLTANAHAAVSDIAKALQLSEAEATLALPAAMTTAIDAQFALDILTQLPTWGRLTTIIHSCGSIFEVKADFPKGKLAHGFYNLMGREGQLHGHLRLDLVASIALVSKPFRGTDSHYIGFYDQAGECMFKVYLGRDKKRQLFPEQIERFNALKQELIA